MVPLSPISGDDIFTNPVCKLSIENKRPNDIIIGIIDRDIILILTPIFNFNQWVWSG
jgi:hypothetical protein